MYMDYLDLMLLNLAAGFFLLAHFSYKARREEDYKSWAPGFGLVGLIALATGFALVFVWPLPGSYNIVYGTSSVLMGGLYTLRFGGVQPWLAAHLAVVFALIAGATAILFGSPSDRPGSDRAARPVWGGCRIGVGCFGGFGGPSLAGTEDETFDPLELGGPGCGGRGYLGCYGIRCSLEPRLPIRQVGPIRPAKDKPTSSWSRRYGLKKALRLRVVRFGWAVASQCPCRWPLLVPPVRESRAPRGNEPKSLGRRKSGRDSLDRRRAHCSLQSTQAPAPPPL